MQPDLEDFTLRIIPENTNNTHNTYFGRLLFNSIFHSRDINFPIRHFILRHLVDIEEDEQYEEETSNNPNFMQEKNMNFRLYPFYINWKKIEHNESGYYRIYLKYGYLGSAVFASFKDKYPSLDVKNFLYILAEFIQENLVIKNNESKNDENEKNIKDFFDKLPNINELFELIEKKIIMIKEVPLLILILKIFEIKFILSQNYDDIINELFITCRELLTGHIDTSNSLKYSSQFNILNQQNERDKIIDKNKYEKNLIIDRKSVV